MHPLVFDEARRAVREKNQFIARIDQVDPRHWSDVKPSLGARLRSASVTDHRIVATVLADLAQHLSLTLGDGSEPNWRTLLSRRQNGSLESFYEELDHLLNGWVSAPSPVEAATRFVRSHLDSRLRVHDIAQATGCSTDQLRRDFGHHLDATVHQFVTRERARRAAELILLGEKVEFAMLAVGYHNKTHFLKVFRQFNGANPSRLRQEAIRASDHRSRPKR